MRKIWLGSAALTASLTVYLLTLAQPVATAAPGKNLQVYPKDTDTKNIKEDMKKMSKALGVQCDFCHDMEGMDKDSEHKTKARDMMRMTASINDQLKKASFKKQVTCNTCHLGKTEPKQ